MGNLLSNPEVREEKWCIDGNRTCAQCVANHVTYSETDSILHQLLRLSMAYGTPNIESQVIDESMAAGGMVAKFTAAIKTTLPGLGSVQSYWILHYSPAIFVTGESSRRESFVVIDRTTMYLFIPAGACCGCGSPDLKNQEEIRIPLISVLNIIADENEDEFTITANLCIRGRNFLNWKTPKIVQERSFKLHTKRRAEILRVLKGMMNVLHFGISAANRACQLKQMPASVENMGDIVPEEYLDQRARGCFEAKFLAHLYGSPAIDDACVIPAVWAATVPSHVHTYLAYFRPDYKCKEYIPRAYNGLYEFVPAIGGSEPVNGNILWSDIPIAERIRKWAPPFRLPSLIQSCSGKLLAHSPLGVVSLFDLHGSEYCKSSQTATKSWIDKQRNATEPGYACCSDGSVVSGQIRWHRTFSKVPRLVAQTEIVIAALRAAAASHTKNVDTISFDRLAFDTHEAGLDALVAMADVCRNNTSLRRIAFPYIHVDDGAPLTPELSKRYNAAWKEISDALLANPKPKFVFFDIRGSHLTNDDLTALLPSLTRLFSTNNQQKQGSLRPVGFLFDDNSLSAEGVSSFCRFLSSSADLSDIQELSFSGNAWTDIRQVDAVGALVEVVSKCPKLRVLNVQAKHRHFPHMAALRAALVSSMCPLEHLSAGGARLNTQVAEDWVSAIINIAQAKATTMKSLCIVGTDLSVLVAVKLLSSLPTICVDLSEEAVTNAFPGGYKELDSAVMVRELNLAKNSFHVLQWWATVPRLLVHLDLSDVSTTDTQFLFMTLNSAVQTLMSNIALQSLSLARISLLGSSSAEVKGFTDLLRTMLVYSSCVQLKRLDISGCHSGLAGLQTLGECLRKNRTLNCLYFDGQRGERRDVYDLPIGWKALRGCFYGNKKIIELSYPWNDINDYFAEVAGAVEVGMRNAASVKEQIGRAHRSGLFRQKAAKIQEIIAIKKEFKSRERIRIGSVKTLFQIYDSVRVNAQLATAASDTKLAAKRATPQAEEARQKFAEKMQSLLIKIISALHKFASTVQRGTNAVEWSELGALLAIGPRLFSSENISSFGGCVEAVGGDSSEALGRILNSADQLTAKIGEKAMSLGQTEDDYINDIIRSGLSIFDEFGPIDFFASMKLLKAIPKKKKNKKDGSDDGDDVDADDGGDDQIDRCSSISLGSHHSSCGSHGNDDTDGANEALIAIELANECGADADANDTYEPVDMYGGAGPTDLPDGDADHNHDAGGAASGKRARSWTHLLKWACLQQASFPTTKPVARFKEEISLTQRVHKKWNNILVSAIDHSSDILLRTLEYQSTPLYLSTCDSSSSTPSLHRVCTLVTQCSVDRLEKLENQARAWGGVLSVAIYISTASVKETESTLLAVRDLVEQLRDDSSYKGELLVSVLYGHENAPWKWDCAGSDNATGPLYPINALRNLAVSVTKSALLFLVDVDFLPSAGLEQWVESASSILGSDSSDRNLLERCSKGELIVIPAFERGCDESVLPKSALNQLSVAAISTGLDEGSITPFHVQHFPAGHSPTDYERWKRTPVDYTTYEVAYGEYYEPYVIISKDVFVPYDERFRGYGMNKCVHLRALSERGCTFHVLPGHYVIAESHAKSESHQRTYGCESGYRKHLVAAAYRVALRDTLDDITPAISATTAKLLQQVGDVRHKKSNKKMMHNMKKELKSAVVQMIYRSKDLVLGTSTLTEETCAV